MSNIKAYKRINLIVFIFMILRFINCFIPASTLYILLLTVIESSAILLYIDDHGIACNIKLLVIITSLLSSVFFSWMLMGNNNLMDLVSSLLALCLGYYMARITISRKVTMGIFAFFSCTILVRFLLTRSVDSIFLRTSRNSISAFLILAAALFYSTYQSGERVSIIPAMITFLFSCIGIGRGGVISSFVLLVGIIMITVFSKKKPSILQILIVFISLCIFVYLISNHYEGLFSSAVNRLLSQNLLQNERNGILYQYFMNIKNNKTYLLWGVPSTEIALVDYLNGNFHNSFLTLHSKFGIVGFISIAVLLVTATKNCIYNHKWLYLLLLVVISLRMLTDGLAFVGLYDSLFYYMTFLCIMDNSTTDIISY